LIESTSQGDVIDFVAVFAISLECCKRFLLTCSLLSAQIPQQSVPTELINGRTITPLGHTVPLAPFPFAMTVRPDGGQIVAPSIGWPFSLNIVDHPGGGESVVRRIPSSKKNDPEVQVHTGVAYSPDGKRLYDATGDSGAVDVLSTEDWHRVARIPLDGKLNGQSFSGSFSASLVLSPDGRTLYVLDQGNWRVVVIDVRALQCIGLVATGVNPFALALSPDGRRLYVSNSGLFEYKLIGPRSDEAGSRMGLRFPPTGYPSREAREGTVVEGHRIPALGSENDPRGSSLWSYTLAQPEAPAVVAKLRLGETITEKPRELSVARRHQGSRRATSMCT
jgi:YVTN family beta-propeller protein